MFSNALSQTLLITLQPRETFFSEALLKNCPGLLIINQFKGKHGFLTFLIEFNRKIGTDWYFRSSLNREEVVL